MPEEGIKASQRVNPIDGCKKTIGKCEIIKFCESKPLQAPAHLSDEKCFILIKRWSIISLWENKSYLGSVCISGLTCLEQSCRDGWNTAIRLLGYQFYKLFIKLIK